MVKRQRIILTAVLMFGWVHMAIAGPMSVVDEDNLRQAVAQVEAWKQQFAQMKSQLEHMQTQYKSLNGIRNMAGLVNNPALRQYLPADYQSILNNGYGNWASIRAQSKVFGIEETTLGANTDTAKAFDANAKQVAINRAIAEEGYKQASQRFADIQVLLNKIDQAPDAKDIADLQARIQVEQVMMQNEANKLQMLAQLAQAQRDLAAQQAAERRMKATRGGLPPGW